MADQRRIVASRGEDEAERVAGTAGPTRSSRYLKGEASRVECPTLDAAAYAGTVHRVNGMVRKASVGTAAEL